MHSLPKNLEEEIQKFFDNDCKINPQFEYENPALTTKLLASFKQPSDEHMDIACKIIDSFLNEFGSETEMLLRDGEVLTEEETQEYFNSYIADLGL